jgi:hypothetical protein
MSDVSADMRFETNPDFKDVEKLMFSSWDPPCLIYDIDVLKLHIMRPSGNPKLGIGLRSAEGQLVSYIAHIPFYIKFFDLSLNIVFGSFWAVAPEYRRKNFAFVTQKKAIETAIELGFDMLFLIIEAGSVSNHALEKVSIHMALECSIIHSFNYYAGIFPLIKQKLPSQPSGFTRIYNESDIDNSWRLLNSLGRGTALRKIVPRDDVDFVLRTRPRTRTFIFERDGEIRGLVNILLLQVLDKKKQDNIYFENIATSHLSPEEKQLFFSDIFYYLQKEKFSASFVPDIGYFEIDPFRKMNFRLAPRRLNLYGMILNKKIFTNGIPQVDKFYLDIF